VAGQGPSGSRAAVNYPDVLLVANQYQISVPPPFVVGSEFAGVIVEVATAQSDLVVGDRVTGTGCSAPSPRRSWWQPIAGPDSDGVDDRTAAAFGVAHRTAYHALRSVARIRCRRRRGRARRGRRRRLAAVQLGYALGADRHRCRIVGRKARRGSHTAPSISSSRSGDLRAALRDACPTARTPSSTRSAATVRARASVAAARRSVRHHRLRIGRHPRIPLNSGSGQGCARTGIPVSGRRPDEFARNEAELGELLATGRVAPHIGAVYPLAERRAR
jgi:NADPH2:quinone reductase